MIKLKQQLNLFIVPTKNCWWILKLTGNKTVNAAQIHCKLKKIKSNKYL
jgi:hypothetical protein